MRPGWGLELLARTRKHLTGKHRDLKVEDTRHERTTLTSKPQNLPFSLKDMLKAKGLTASWQSAVTYQLIHSLALLSLSTREVDHSSSVKWNWVGTVSFLP